MKTLRGITVMRNSIVLIIGTICLLWVLSAPASEKYWENIGPNWNKMLNPDTHNQ